MVAKLTFGEFISAGSSSAEFVPRADDGTSGLKWTMLAGDSVRL